MLLEGEGCGKEQARQPRRVAGDRAAPSPKEKVSGEWAWYQHPRLPRGDVSLTLGAVVAGSGDGTPAGAVEGESFVG